MGNPVGLVTILLLVGASSLAPCLEYPQVFRNESTVDDYHGTLVSDPYRWLEDPGSPQTLEFVEVENNLTRSYLDASPVRDAIREQFRTMWNYAKIDPPSKHGDQYFYYANSGLLNQKVLYKKSSIDSEPEVFFDPNEISENGTIAITTETTSFSPNGSIFAFGLSTSGSDWSRIYFKNTETGEDLEDVLTKARFTSIQWKADGSGIFYGAYPHLEEGDPGVANHQKILFHRIGTEQSEDVLICEFTESPHLVIANIGLSQDGHTIIITPSGDGSLGDRTVYVAQIPENITGKFEWIPVVSQFTAHYTYIFSIDSLLYFKTNKDAPNSRIVAIDLSSPNEPNWITIVPEHETKVIDMATLANRDKLVIVYLEDVKSRVAIVNATDGSTLVDDYPLEIGAIYDYSHSDIDDPLFFFKFQSFLLPNRIYMVNFTSDVNDLVIHEDVTLEGIDPSNFVTNQVFYPSKDGTLIPMFIIHKKDIPLDGENFANLYGYGGFGLKTQPEFSVPRVVFMEHFNGVAALANIRGGGEYGDIWHRDGMLEKKQNVFDDFQAAGEYLIQNNFTKTSKLIIQGASNGGLLIGACINQRPDLFGAALADVGVMDMLRFHRFTIGYAWVPEYGSADNPDQFEYIYKYSPLHNIRIGNDTQYPPTLVTTSLQDDRVVPAHSMKYVAELQYTIGRDARQTNPLLIRIEDDAGHGDGKPVSKQIEEQVDIFTFLTESIGLTLAE